MLLCEFGAKTYTEGKPNNRFHLSFSQEYDLDSYILSIYPFVVFLANYSENTPIAGYIKEEFGLFNVFSFQDGLVYWQEDLQIVKVNKHGKLDYYELLALGTKIKYSVNERRQSPHLGGKALVIDPELGLVVFKTSIWVNSNKFYRY